MLLDDPERFVMEDEERADFERLSVFLTAVAENPSKFPPTGKMAKSVRKIVRAGSKREAQPQSRRNKRKERQERRMRTAKALRKTRREDAEAYNKARAVIEAEQKEAEEAQRELEERWATEPKFNVLNQQGEVILAEVPSSMIRSVEESQALADAELIGHAQDARDALDTPKVILPGSAEALGIETP